MNHGLLYSILTIIKQSKDARESDNLLASKVGREGLSEVREG